MKKRLLIPLLLLCLGAWLVAPVNSARAETEISFQFFYDSLAPYGEWVTVGEYGSAWHPAEVDNDWSPYQEGSWAYTEGGWTWVSSEPWGDVVYHYGRWVQVNDYGWCWVPGYEWAPAWVSWRSSDNYVGWAPLPPEAEWRPNVGFSVWTDSYYDIGPRNYRFCHVRDFCEPNLRRVCRPRSENYNLMGLTINITNINYNQDDRRVFCGGPRLDYFQDRTERPVRHLRLVEEHDYQRSQVRGEEYRYSRPSLAADPYRGHDNVRDKIVRNLNHDKVDHGWRNSGDEDQRHSLRSRVQDQVRGLTPDNRHASIVAKSAGGVSREELHSKNEHRSDGKDKDRDDERSRGPEKSKGPTTDPRLGGRDDGKHDKAEQVRRAIPLPLQADPANRTHKAQPQDKHDRDDKPKTNDPRKPSNDDTGRSGIPMPNPRGDSGERGGPKPKDKDEGGASRAPMPQKKVTPNPMPHRDTNPDRVAPKMPKPQESPKKVAPNPMPHRDTNPDRVAPKMPRPSQPQQRVESAPRPKQPQQAPKIVRPQPQPKPQAPKVAQRPAPPSAPKPQASPNKRSSDGDKKKEDDKRHKR